jgi:hypothetical protein
MKKLVLTSIIAAGTSLAVGCTVVEDDPVIIADITLLNGGPGPIVCLNSPTAFPGRDGLRVNARLTGTTRVISDVYNCDVFALQTPPLPDGIGEYEIWVDYINDRGFPDDPSQWAVVDETDTAIVFADTDVHVTAVLTLNNGFFEANWSISDTGGPVTMCPPGGGMSILGTIVGTSTAFDDIYNCEDGFNSQLPVITAATPIEEYTIVATLLDDQDNRLGASDPLTAADGAVISTGNEYQDLGVIDIILD